MNLEEVLELSYLTKSVVNVVETSSKARAITIWRGAAVVSAVWMAARTTCGVLSGPPKAANMRTTVKNFSEWVEVPDPDDDD